MYAIVEIAGKQYKLAEGMTVNVDKLETEGNEINFDKVLLLVTENDIRVGNPTIPNVEIKAEIVDREIKGDKIVIFKWKRRKNYRKKNGHRQKYSKLKITQIVA
jgi:large subunit ribosomal protein L21